MSKKYDSNRFYFHTFFLCYDLLPTCLGKLHYLLDGEGAERSENPYNSHESFYLCKRQFFTQRSWGGGRWPFWGSTDDHANRGCFSIIFPYLRVSFRGKIPSCGGPFKGKIQAFRGSFPPPGVNHIPISGPCVLMIIGSRSSEVKGHGLRNRSNCPENFFFLRPLTVCKKKT